MPELPEVETIKRGLKMVLIGKKIKSIKIFNKKQFLGRVQLLLGKKINKIERRAKLLIFKFEKLYLLIHLKMSGQLIFFKKKKLIIGGHPEKKYEKLPNKYTRIIINFSDGSQLYFNDLRKFGWLKVVKEKEYQNTIIRYGKEALFLKEKDLLKLIQTGRGPTIKQLLTNQVNIAGIGNIYADESLFCAKINPFRLTKSITAIEIKRLLICIKKVLKLAIKHQGISEQFYRTIEGGFGTYGQVAKVYAKTGQSCKNCNTRIIKKKLVGRGTHFCPNCQKIDKI
jgi:formamidopyrimidine-DNA glycosylase